MNIKIETVKTDTVENYFALPKEQREKRVLGIAFYRKPYALPWNTFWLSGAEGGWSQWEARIKKEYPVQSFFREYLPSMDFPPYYYWVIAKARLSDFWWSIKRIFKPAHKRFRKACPRTRYMDAFSIIEEGNLALLCDFREEVVNSCVDWGQSGKGDFPRRLNAFADWIENDREKESKKIEEEIFKTFKYLPDSEDYKKVSENYNKLIQEKKDKESAILEWMINERESFWT